MEETVKVKTRQEILQEKINAKIAERALAEESAQDALLNNDFYITEMTKLSIADRNKKSLQAIADLLNNIPKQKLGNTGEEATIMCYPIAPECGEEVSMLLGIANAASSAYVDEHKLLCESYTTSLTLASALMTAVGTPQRWSTRTFTISEVQPTNYELAIILLKEYAKELKIPLLDTSKFTVANIANYITRESLKAKLKEATHLRNQAVDADDSSDYTL